MQEQANRRGRQLGTIFENSNDIRRIIKDIEIKSELIQAYNDLSKELKRDTEPYTEVPDTELGRAHFLHRFCVVLSDLPFRYTKIPTDEERVSWLSELFSRQINGVSMGKLIDDFTDQLLVLQPRASVDETGLIEINSIFKWRRRIYTFEKTNYVFFSQVSNNISAALTHIVAGLSVELEHSSVPQYYSLSPKYQTRRNLQRNYLMELKYMAIEFRLLASHEGGNTNFSPLYSEFVTIYNELSRAGLLHRESPTLPQLRIETGNNLQQLCRRLLTIIVKSLRTYPKYSKLRRTWDNRFMFRNSDLK